MGIGISFILNLSALITVAYLTNILYKYGLREMPQRSLYVLSVLMMIFSGWICIKFGFRLHDDVRFDLRAVPLIIAAFVYSQPLTLIIIGFGIGLARRLGAPSHGKQRKAGQHLFLLFAFKNRPIPFRRSSFTVRVAVKQELSVKWGEERMG